MPATEELPAHCKRCETEFVQALTNDAIALSVAIAAVLAIVAIWLCGIPRTLRTRAVRGVSRVVRGFTLHNKLKIGVGFYLISTQVRDLPLISRDLA